MCLRGHALCFGYEQRGVAGLCDLDSHGPRSLTRGEPIDGSGYFGGAALELALELGDEQCGFFLIALLEYILYAQQHGPRHYCDCGRDRRRKQQE
jgi:hypothetical protein